MKCSYGAFGFQASYTVSAMTVRVELKDAQLQALVGAVLQQGLTILLTQEGEPIAKLVPAGGEHARRHLSMVKGWLEDDDPFFKTVDELVEARFAHHPRSSPSFAE